MRRQTNNLFQLSSTQRSQLNRLYRAGEQQQPPFYAKSWLRTLRAMQNKGLVEIFQKAPGGTFWARITEKGANLT